MGEQQGRKSNYGKQGTGNPISVRAKTNVSCGNYL